MRATRTKSLTFLECSTTITDRWRTSKHRRRPSLRTQTSTSTGYVPSLERRAFSPEQSERQPQRTRYSPQHHINERVKRKRTGITTPPWRKVHTSDYIPPPKLPPENVNRHRTENIMGMDDQPPGPPDHPLRPQRSSLVWNALPTPLQRQSSNVLDPRRLRGETPRLQRHS